MATKVIHVDILSPSSIGDAINELDRFKEDLARKMETFLDRLAEVGRETAQGIFGGTTTVTVEKSPNGRRIVAQGTDEAYFVEFGTGAYAGSESGQYLTTPSIVFPGSFSESEKGKGTWNAWISAGKSAESYPYNSAPQSAMYKAYEVMCLQSESIAREVFGK